MISSYAAVPVSRGWVLEHHIVLQLSLPVSLLSRREPSYCRSPLDYVDLKLVVGLDDYSITYDHCRDLQLRSPYPEIAATSYLLVPPVS